MVAECKSRGLYTKDEQRRKRAEIRILKAYKA
jgi:hypothetical protein